MNNSPINRRASLAAVRTQVGGAHCGRAWRWRAITRNRADYSSQTLAACDPPRLLGFTWGNPAQPSEVRFELTPQGNEVRLVVTHSRLQPGDMATTSGGWHTHLDVLADRLAGRQPQPFWPIFSRHLAHYEQAGNA